MSIVIQGRRPTLFWLMLLSLSVPTLSWSGTYWVSNSGSDSNGCTNTTTPQTTGAKHTIQGGIGCVAAGDTLYIRGGTYNENIDSNNYFIPSGTSDANRITIAAYGGETVTQFGYFNLVAHQPGGQATLDYITFDGGTGRWSLDSGGITSIPLSPNGALHLTFQNMDITGASLGGSGIANGYGFAGSQFNIYRNLRVHNNRGHGYYITSSDNIIEGGEIDNNECNGIQIYREGGGANRATVRNVYFHDNGWGGPGNLASCAGGDPTGIILGTGDGSVAYNNIVVNSGIGIFPCCGNRNGAVYNNTIVNNARAGILIDGSSTGSIIRNNIISGSVGGAYGEFADFSGGQYTASSNLCQQQLSGACTQTGNAGWPGAAGGDYHIGAAGSPAVGTGTNLSSIFTTDLEGSQRSAVGAWDLGAYVFAGAPAPSVGLIGKYPFEEGSGTTADDASPFSHICTLNTAGWGPGIIGTSSFSLNGARRCVVTGTSTLRPTATVGIAAWINTTHNNYQYIVDMSGKYGMYLNPSGELRGYATTTGGFFSASSSGVNLRSGTNRHVAMTKDATGLRAWVDGVQVGFSATTAPISYTGSETLSIGRHGAVDQEYFIGRLDQVYVYDTPLTTADVLSLMNESQPSAGTTMPNVGWTVANVVEATSLAQVNNNISHLITLPIGFRAGIQHLGAQITEFFPPTCRMFRQSLGVWSAWTAVTNNFGSLGIRLGTDSAVTMGQLTTQTLLPVGVGFTSVQGRFVVATLNTSVQTTLGDAQRTEWESRLEFGAPLIAGDLVQCRHNRESGAAFDAYGPSAPPDSFTTLTLQGLAPPSNVRIGGLLQGGRTQ